MDKFREGLRYDPNERNKRQIKGKTTRKSQRYNAKKAVKDKIIALALTGSIAIGAGIVIKEMIVNNEEPYISTIEEIQKYNIKAQDLQISQELYEKVLNVIEEIDKHKENNFEGVSKKQLASYYNELSKLYLEVLKSKVSTVTGMKKSDFTLIAPSADGTETKGTSIKDSDRMFGVGYRIESNEIDDYMLDILELDEYSKEISKEEENDNITKGEAKRLAGSTDKLGDVMKTNLLRRIGSKGLFSKDVTELTTYRIETRGLQQQAETQRTASIEK